MSHQWTLCFGFYTCRYSPVYSDACSALPLTPRMMPHRPTLLSKLATCAAACCCAILSVNLHI